MSTKNTLYINPKSGTLLEKVDAIIGVLNVITEKMTETTVPDNKIQADNDNLQTLANLADVEYKRISNEFEKATGGN